MIGSLLGLARPRGNALDQRKYVPSLVSVIDPRVGR